MLNGVIKSDCSNDATRKTCVVVAHPPPRPHGSLPRGEKGKDGFGSDTDTAEIGSGCHLLPHFNLDTNANADLIGYEYKMDSLNPDSNPDTCSI